MKLHALALALAFAFAIPALPAWADPVLTLGHGSVWQTEKDGQDTQGFVQIQNTGDAADTLTKASCTIGDATLLVDGQGKPLQSVTIPPGQTITFSATGPHLLIKAARYPIAKDGILPCAFTFALSGELIGYLNGVKGPGGS